MSEPDPATHREAHVQLQAAIDEVVATCRDWSVSDTITALNDAIARRGRPPQPERWVEAVAVDAVAGRTYVVSGQALQDTGTDVPAHDAIEDDVGRDRGHEPG